MAPGPGFGETTAAAQADATSDADPVDGPVDLVPVGARLVGDIAERVGSAREARWIVEHTGGDVRWSIDLADRRAAGEPLQYVLGRWPFRTLELAVDRRVLIPRPETEHVVEVALAELAELVDGGTGDDRGPARTGRGPGPVAVDLGTGSGAIALSLAVEGGARAPGLVVWATDVSADALSVAAGNLAKLARVQPGAADRVRLSEGRWFDALPPELGGSLDLVVSNPPYVAEADFPGLDPTVRRWEPRGALVAAGSHGVGGLADIEAVVDGAARWLRPGGILVVEIDPAQADATLASAGKAGFTDRRTEPDLSGRVRMVVARR
jgi:release factor glutamine methyltransferase